MPETKSPPSPMALDGVRVLDLSRVLAGPWATQLLGDFGADVIKVERPGIGDDTRQWGPPFLTSTDGSQSDATYFLCANRNKRAVAVDLSTTDGQTYLRRLASKADVIVENFKVGALHAYGLDYDSLSALNPRLVYCSLTGFGQTGPAAKLPGYDHLIQAMGGLMSITGSPRGAPMKTGVAIADLFAGMYAANAILAALHHARETGEGQHIDISLFDCQVAMLANQASAYLATGKAPKRRGNTHPSIAPYDVYQASDGAMVVTVGNDRQFAQLANVIGKPDLALGTRFATNAARVRRLKQLNAILAPVFKQKSRDHWRMTLSAVGVPCGPVNSLLEVFEDPQVRARGMVDDVDSPERGARVKLVANPVKFSATPVSKGVAPPVLPSEDGPRPDWRTTRHSVTESG